MSAVGGVGASNLVSGQAGLAGGALTVDSIMLYCAAQLNHLDTDIQKHMAQQQVARDQQDKLGRLKSLMSGSIPEGPAGVEAKKAIMQAMKDAHDALAKTDPGGADQLNQLFHDFITTGSFNDSGDERVKAGDGNNLFSLSKTAVETLANAQSLDNKNSISVDEMKNMQAKVDPILSDVGKGAELEMINLQSMVSQRQMAVQIATQLISKTNETLMSIVSNVGKS